MAKLSPAFAPLSNSSLAEQARKQIREAIFEGRLKPDENLTIDRIAQELGISRTPVREALKALEADGLVQIFPRRGAIVQRLSPEDIEDLYTIRALLEGFAGEQACRRGGDALLAQLQENQDQLADALERHASSELDDAKILMQLNDTFHRSIAEASGSPRLQRFLALTVMPLGYRLYYWRSPERQRASFDFHSQIIDAFRAHDCSRARRLLEQHVLEARDFLLSIAGHEETPRPSANRSHGEPSTT